MNKFVLICVSLAAGIGLGTLIPDSRAIVEAGGARASSSAPVQATLAESGATLTLDIEPIRAMLREELNAALAGSKVSQVSQVSQGSAQVQLGAPAAVSTLSVQQQRDTLQAIEGVVNGGRWDDEERNDFHQKLAQLDPQQREQAMQQLVQAINSGSLKVSTSGPIL